MAERKWRSDNVNDRISTIAAFFGILVAFSTFLALSYSWSYSKGFFAQLGLPAHVVPFYDGFQLFPLKGMFGLMRNLLSVGLVILLRSLVRFSETSKWNKSFDFVMAFIFVGVSLLIIGMDAIGFFDGGSKFLAIAVLAACFAFGLAIQARHFFFSRNRYGYCYPNTDSIEFSHVL
jgi:hypothetical protein